MSNGQDHYVAGCKTHADWQALKARLSADAFCAWREAFTDYYKNRLDLRYLDPIKVLQSNGTLRGEGFSIVAIQCSLIEFLESTEQGLNYRYTRRGVPLGPYEYNSSKDIFVDFLKGRTPFSLTFNESTALEFYIGVRCGVLHEARTKNGWRVRAQSPDGVVANLNERIVYRNNFQKALLEYIEDYGERLLKDTALQQAFIRKFDSLCD